MAPLIGQCRHGNSPAAVERPDQRRSRQSHVGHEHLVELGPAGHLPQRPGLDAGRVHVDHEERNSLVFRGFFPRQGAGQEDAPVRSPCPAGPDLLAVDDELLPVGHRPGRQRGQVGTGARLGEQLAPHPLAASGRRQVSLLLLGRAVRQQRAGGQHQPNHVQHRRHAGDGGLFHPGRRVFQGQAGAADRFGPVDGGKTPVVQAFLPSHTLVPPLGRHDGAPVGRRGGRVLRQPGGGRLTELVDGHAAHEKYLLSCWNSSPGPRGTMYPSSLRMSSKWSRTSSRVNAGL